MSEIYSKIIEFVEENNDVYTKRWLQIKLKVKYWELVILLASLRYTKFMQAVATCAAM